jgi:hypothetical protein
MPCGVQGNGTPNAADVVLGHAVALQEAAGFVRAIHLKASPALEEPLVQTQIMEHRTDVEESGIVAEPTVAALHASEPEDRSLADPFHPSIVLRSVA